MILFHAMLALGMLVTGSINTITTKAADMTNSVGRSGVSVAFNHPFFQAAAMFLGELLCLGAFFALLWWTRRKAGPGAVLPAPQKFNPAIFWIPALCDMTATSLMNVGLSLTDASVFQMLRGSVVVFTATASLFFLKRKLRSYHWIGVVLVVGGTAIVGSQTVICPPAGGSSASSDASRATIGNILIIIAQVVVACQMVVEEKFISGYNVPALQVVGLEGAFGLGTLSVVLVAMYFFPKPAFLCAAGDNCSHFEDSIDAFVQMGNSWQLSLALVGNVISIAFFNFCGVSVTKHMSASTRMVLDSLRTLVIWGFSMGVGWESFCWVEILGFIVLIAGALIYNALLKLPCCSYEQAGEGSSSTDAAKTVALLEGHESEDARAGLLAGSLNGADATAVTVVPGTPLASMDSLMNTPTMGKARALKGR